jgi:methyl-accepting chemotaxis protein
MKTRPKILLGFAVPTLVASLCGVVVFRAGTESLNPADRVRHTEQVIASANALVRGAVEGETGERGFVITGDDAFLAPFNQGLATFDQTAPQLRALVADNPPQVARVDQMIQLHQRWVSAAGTPEIAARRAGGIEVAARLIENGTGKGLIDQLRSAVDQFIGTEQSLLRSRTASSASVSRTAKVLLLVGFGLVVVLGLGIGLALSGRLSSNIQAVASAAEGVAAGDLTRRARVRSDDEIGELARSFNSMAGQLQAIIDSERATKDALEKAVREYSAFAARIAEGDLTARVAANGTGDLQTLSENLNGMVIGLAELSGQVRNGVQSMRSTTSEILAAVSQHTASASQQSAAITQTSSTVDEARAASEQTARKAKEVAEQARASVKVSDDGTKAAETIARAMEQIRDRVQAIARDILTLSEQTQQIGEITATVDDLADQSNILALNASIEAAKAGEHGKGFAVVAAEVRNLAEQSKAATDQVRGILSDIQKATTGAVLATEHGTKVVDEGLVLTEQARVGIRSLAETIREAAQAAQQIAASAHQQSIGMDQIAEAMKEVNEGTTQFVAGAQQSQRAAEDLNELSQNLSSLAERYRV